MRKNKKETFVAYLNEKFIDEYLSNKKNIEDTLFPFIENGSIEGFSYIFEDDGSIHFSIDFDDDSEKKFYVKNDKIVFE